MHIAMWESVKLRLKDIFPARQKIIYQAIGSARKSSIFHGVTRGSLLINTVLFVLYTTIFLVGMVLSLRGPQKEAGLIYSPARSAVSYAAETYDSSLFDVWKKQPDRSVDHAWHRLLKYNNLALPAEDLERINKTVAVQLRNSEDYLAGLDVFHELHCLNYLREYAFREYYQMERSDKAREEHLGHCMDNIRQTFMCHGDIAVHHYNWDPQRASIVRNPRVTRECRAFKPLRRWAKEHSPDDSKGPILEHPQLGIVEPTVVNKTQA